ncbi:hypothetical protein J5S49_01810 [Virgibacillus halodenitrificans]|uniref:hypothetical protein n=1 Tax=Virgibacillus halodenitrificans TaxID=1482 RepID=UPI001F16E489|nr:hypothetical protein [Virgibacillus halodenitrificans]MCG1027025.1 hypothetical protein [Virgibacillus halodenitrificans]
MINTIDGVITFEDKNAFICPYMTIEEFKSTSLYEGETIKNNYQIKDKIELKDMFFYITLFFNNNNLVQVHLTKAIEGLTWSNWTPDLEIKKKQNHEEWLLNNFGTPPYVYSWGTIESNMDRKGGVSSIIIKYS